MVPALDAEGIAKRGTRMVKIWRLQEGQEGAHCGSVGGGGELMEWAGILAFITGTVD